MRATARRRGQSGPLLCAAAVLAVLPRTTCAGPLDPPACPPGSYSRGVVRYYHGIAPSTHTSTHNHTHTRARARTHTHTQTLSGLAPCQHDPSVSPPARSIAHRCLPGWGRRSLCPVHCALLLGLRSRPARLRSLQRWRKPVTGPGARGREPSARANETGQRAGMNRELTWGEGSTWVGRGPEAGVDNSGSTDGAGTDAKFAGPFGALPSESTCLAAPLHSCHACRP